uniref:Uncharacterized protein n=1 Tax=Romanomermis culicivorax TaxID=13658 RepID=A0A915HLL2_ROMCU
MPKIRTLCQNYPENQDIMPEFVPDLNNARLFQTVPDIASKIPDDNTGGFLALGSSTLKFIEARVSTTIPVHEKQIQKNFLIKTLLFA